jgi:RNA polymerase sigma-70 factor (ECF subfamily)
MAALPAGAATLRTGATMPIDRRELERLIPALRRYARGMTGDRTAADDMVQDCLVRALDRESQFRGENLPGWIFAILTNVVRSKMRSVRRQPQISEITEIAATGDADPATRIAILAALSGLSEEQRQPLLLTAVEGFSYREAADMLDVPIGTVMSRIARARTALTERLDGAPIVPLRRVK